jgi:hypothetical protein
MVFTNPIMTTHVNKIIDWPSMSLIVAGRYISADARNIGRGYWKPSIITTRIPDHKNGHSMKPNMVALKYLDVKKMLTQMLMSKCSIM